jgi:hypothetical protein
VQSSLLTACHHRASTLGGEARDTCENLLLEWNARPMTLEIRS